MQLCDKLPQMLTPDIAVFDLREQFKGTVGVQFKLRLRGKGGERRVTLTLADQV